MKLITEIVQQHSEEAAFLWMLRDFAVRNANYKLSDIVDLDNRVEANIDGLRVAGLDGWSIASDELASQEPGDVFTSGVLALEAFDEKRFEKVYSVAVKSKGNFRALVSALGWLENSMADNWLRNLVTATSIQHRALGFASLSIRRRNLEQDLVEALGESQLLIFGRILRSVGELKRRDLVRDVRAHLRSDDEAFRFWSSWSIGLLGDKNIGETLQSFVDFNTQFAYRAIQLAPRILAPDKCRNWLRGLAQDEDLRRYALIGCGVTGDPVYISTLISQMSVPEHARVAGEAFSMITGVDLAYEDLDMDQPEDFEAGPNDDPEDENVDLDPDEDLPWPNPELIRKWWDDHGREYRPGVRYLCGQPISDENCRRVLREGYQRQRIAAAYELALMNPDEPLFEWRAPGWRQQEWLGLRKPRAERSTIL